MDHSTRTYPMMRLLVLVLLGAWIAAADAPAPVAPRTGLGDLGAAKAYEPAGGIVDIDISEYAGYAGLIAANHGLDPSPDSVFAREHGFQVRLRLSESENWGRLNQGAFAASATTADVLALLGPQMKVSVPLLLSYSRGADGIIARTGLKTINDLAGKTVVTSQFNESDFLIRYLAQEANLPVSVLADPAAQPVAGAVNLLFAEDGFAAGDLFLAELGGGGGRIAGCVTWAPKTTEVVASSAGQARQLISNRNLLVVADVLMVNAGFAAARPQQVRGLVHGILTGNRMVRSDPAAWLPVVGKAFGWDAAQAKTELSKVHLANRAENLAFFNGTIDAAGSFPYILQCANLVYADYVSEPVEPKALADLSHLDALATQFPGERIEIQPETGGSAQVEPETVVKRDVRFLFEANSSNLAADDRANRENLERLANWLRAGPGSVLLLVGHVEPSQRDRLRREMGQKDADAMAQKLGQERADEVRRVLTADWKVDAARISAQSRGWTEPIPGERDMSRNRRVEVQWKMLE
jgi:NitT/TauT family transport system substrate-binding protein